MRLSWALGISMLWVVGCSASSIEATPTTLVTQTTESGSVAPATSTASAIEQGQSGGGSPDDPLPVGDATLSGFAYEDIFLGASWEGFVSGLVETGPGEFSDSEGRCLLLLGTLTPTAIDEGSVTTGFQTPGISVIADGQQIQSEFGNCDTSIAEAAGYGWILEAEVTVGTTYPFYDEIFLAGATPPELETVVVGDPSNSEALYYEPTVLSEIPAP